MKASATVARHADWREALSQAMAELAPRQAENVDLALFFASAEYADEFPELLAEARRFITPGCLIGCSGQGVIGGSREIEGEPALSLLTLSLPGADLRPLHVTQGDVANCRGPENWCRLTGVPSGAVNAWFVFADPFTLDAEALINELSGTYRLTPIVGGLASGNFNARRTHLFLDGEVYDEGAVLLAVGGPYTVRTVVSQGATPIGQTWTITDAEQHIIRTIAQRPAYEVLVQTVRQLPPEMRQRVQGNLLVGLAMDEYRDEFHRGDFLIRNLLGLDPESGAIAVGALPRVGQTLQFQLRDPAAADEDLRELLGRARADLGGQEPLGALLCSCNGRGVGLFGSPHHDAQAVSELLGPVPLAGFFCNGEIGPIASQVFLHGFTASIGLLLPSAGGS